MRPRNPAIAVDQSALIERPPVLACVILAVGNPDSLIDAVRSIVEQDAPVEIIVVNTGGGNPAASLAAADLNVTVVTHPDILHAGGARNLGIQHANAPIVSFLASDCMAQPGWARRRIEAHSSGALVVSSSVCSMFPKNIAAIAAHIVQRTRRMELIPQRYWLNYGCSYDRSLFLRFGPFREDLRTGEDTDFNDRLRRAGIEFISRPDVRTAHRYETSFWDLLRGHFARGRHRARFMKALPRPVRKKKNAIESLKGSLRTIRRAWQATLPKERWRIILAYPYILLASIAESCGALLDRGDPSRPSSCRQVRILALLAFRNEMAYLPGWFANVSPHVDGVIALDDGSTDGSGDFAAEQSCVLELLRNPANPEHPHQYQLENKRRLIEAAGRHGADWIIVVDADERLERHFRLRALNAVARAEREGISAYSIVFRELWDSADTYRADAVWGKKGRAHFFKWRADHEFDQRRFHNHWAPLNSRRNNTFPRVDLIKYHLRMIRAADRDARRRKFERIDPECLWQPRGYAYLTQTEGIVLQKLESGREYVPLPP